MKLAENPSERSHADGRRHRTLIFVLRHPLAWRRSARFSVRSTLRSQRIFTATHCRRYLQRPRLGIHSAGPKQWNANEF